jgi:hypothetical protein
VMSWVIINILEKTAVLKTRFISIVVSVFLVSSAYAQENSDIQDIPLEKTKKSAAQQKKVRLNFENELVNSKSEKPEIESIFQGTNFNYKKMIKLRQNFIPEAERGQEMFNASY